MKELRVEVLSPIKLDNKPYQVGGVFWVSDWTPELRLAARVGAVTVRWGQRCRLVKPHIPPFLNKATKPSHITPSLPQAPRGQVDVAALRASLLEELKAGLQVELSTLAAQTKDAVDTLHVRVGEVHDQVKTLETQGVSATSKSSPDDLLAELFPEPVYIPSGLVAANAPSVEVKASETVGTSTQEASTALKEKRKPGRAKKEG